MRSEAKISALWPTVFLMAHFPLGLAVSQISSLATLHAYASLAVGLLFAVNPKRSHEAAYTCAYIAGSEVLWRMADASIFWEFGKYAVALICLIVLWQHPKWKILGSPVVYFGLLVPSTLLTMEGFDYKFNDVREAISFNLSGSFALMLLVCAFVRLRFNPWQLARLFIAAIGPTIGVIAATLFSTYFASSIKFTTESNFTTSGGFGPNQVSAVLGMGAFMALFLLVGSPAGRILWFVLAPIAVADMVQAAMTFSRGGVYMALASCIAAAAFLFKVPRFRARLIPMGLFGTLCLMLLVWQLNDFTGGQLLVRLESTSTTNRAEFVAADVDMFLKNPIFGVGPGVGELIRGADAHTEFSRMFAEHGILGIFSLILLGVMGLNAFMKSRNAVERALIASCGVWSGLFMAVYSLRLAAPSFMFALAMISVIPERRRVLQTSGAAAQNRGASYANDLACAGIRR
jgi:hypothetical protein